MPWVIPGESLLGEILELEVALGSRELALIAATRTNGKHIDRGAIGIIETGAKADLLMLENDPIVDLTALSNWRYLTVDGRLYSRSQVNQWLTIYRIHFHDAFYEQVMNNLIGVIARAYGSV
jgi:cytosine/adenosine deaminase-related metal-dependent hydrolase